MHSGERCDARIIYPTRESAAAYLEGVKRRQPGYNGRVYPCSGHFHVGISEGQMMALKRASGRKSSIRNGHRMTPISDRGYAGY